MTETAAITWITSVMLIDQTHWQSLSAMISCFPPESWTGWAPMLLQGEKGCCWNDWLTLGETELVSADFLQWCSDFSRREDQSKLGRDCCEGSANRAFTWSREKNKSRGWAVERTKSLIWKQFVTRGIRDCRGRLHEISSNAVLWNEEQPNRLFLVSTSCVHTLQICSEHRGKRRKRAREL